MTILIAAGWYSILLLLLLLQHSYYFEEQVVAKREAVVKVEKTPGELERSAYQASILLQTHYLQLQLAQRLQDSSSLGSEARLRSPLETENETSQNQRGEMKQERRLAARAYCLHNLEEDDNSWEMKRFLLYHSVRNSRGTPSSEIGSNSLYDICYQIIAKNLSSVLFV
jgi:hypothetical protein